MKKNIARLVSFVGNPLVLAMLVAIYTNYKSFPPGQALKLSAILIGLGIVPIFWYINKKVNQGQYADHDVSARTKRPSLYIFGLMVLAVLIAVLYFTNQPKNIVSGAFAAWLLAAISFLINFKIKTSLHTGFAFLIAFLTLKGGFTEGVVLMIFAFVVAWSRLVLRRHTLQEVFTGAALGSILGAIFYGFVIVG